MVDSRGQTKEIICNGNTLPIRRFKLDSMEPNATIVMIAKRGSGKSFVTRALLKHFDDIPGGIIIAPTDKMSDFYSEFVPSTYIHYEYKTELLEEFLFRQETMVEKAKNKLKKGKKVDPRAYLVMDDCLSSKATWANDKPIREIFQNGRHFKFIYILTMQFPLGVQPELRSNIDYVFLLAEDIISNQKRIYDHYAGIFPSFEAFKQVFSQLTEDYGCMVIANRGANQGLLDKVFWFKADNIKTDIIGCEQFKNFHKKNYDSNWKKKNKIFDINKFVDKKNKKSVTVEKIY